LLNNKEIKNQATKTKRNKVNPPKLMVQCDTLDQGTAAFMQWLSSEDKQSVKNPIILKEFANSKYCLIYDNILGHDVIVETQNGVPRCKNCGADDCGHVGFTICLEQKYDNDGTIFD